VVLRISTPTTPTSGRIQSDDKSLAAKTVFTIQNLKKLDKIIRQLSLELHPVAGRRMLKLKRLGVKCLPWKIP
jgi:hypothetical protein